MTTLFSLLFAAALGATSTPAEVPEASLSWELSVDGAHVGYRNVSVHHDASDARVFQAWTTLSGKRLRGEAKKLRYAQRVTAHSQEGRPASFHSSWERRDTQREIQARRAGTTWKVTVAEGEEARTHSLPHTRVDLSSIDLLDPEAERSLRGRDYARVLIAESGKIEEGPVVSLGRQTLQVAGESVEVEGVQWTTSQGVYRLWYAPNGWLVRWEAPMMGLDVSAQLRGEVPRTVDEFVVADGPGPIEVIDL
jgi:hypothetical protein